MGTSGGLTEPVFFLDRNLGHHRVAAALREAGIVIERHDDHFAQNERDPVVLGEAGRREWLVVTQDDRIRYRAAEKEAVRTHRVGLFIVSAKNLNSAELGRLLIGARHQMVLLARRTERPFIARVTRTGKAMLIERPR